MLTIIVYESEDGNIADDDAVYMVQIQDGEFVQSMLSEDADVDVINEALEMAAVIYQEADELH